MSQDTHRSPEQSVRPTAKPVLLRCVALDQDLTCYLHNGRTTQDDLESEMRSAVGAVQCQSCLLMVERAWLLGTDWIHRHAVLSESTRTTKHLRHAELFQVVALTPSSSDNPGLWQHNITFLQPLLQERLS